MVKKEGNSCVGRSGIKQSISALDTLNKLDSICTSILCTGTNLFSIYIIILSFWEYIYIL